MPAVVEQPTRRSPGETDPESEVYVGPPIQVGDTVLWWNELACTRAPATAIVTKIAMGGKVMLSVIAPESMTFNTNNKNSVRHRKDPTATKDNTGDYSGVWDVSPQTQERCDLRERVRDLEAKVARLIRDFAADEEPPAPKPQKQQMRSAPKDAPPEL